MSITVGEWERRFEKLPREEREKLMEAIKTLEANPDFKEQFGWTRLFALWHSLNLVNWREEHGNRGNG